MQNLQEMPPLVTFKYVPVEDRTASIASGKFTTKDIAFVDIVRPGSKDVFTAEAEKWLDKLAEDARQNRAPLQWATGFRDMFEKWKRGEEIPVEGTPIKNWPAISPSMQNTVVKAGFRTVEELAAAGDAEIGSIGIGALDMRKKARTFLEAASGPGKLTARVEAAEAENAALKKTLESQAAELKRLAGLIGEKAKA